MIAKPSHVKITQTNKSIDHSLMNIDADTLSRTLAHEIEQHRNIIMYHGQVWRLWGMQNVAPPTVQRKPTSPCSLTSEEALRILTPFQPLGRQDQMHCHLKTPKMDWWVEATLVYSQL